MITAEALLFEIVFCLSLEVFVAVGVGSLLSEAPKHNVSLGLSSLSRFCLFFIGEVCVSVSARS